MLNQEDNKFWELRQILMMQLEEEDEKVLVALKFILAMDSAELEEKIENAREICSLQALEDNIVELLVWCRMKNIQTSKTLGYIIKLLCYEVIISNELSHSVCTEKWLIQQNLELETYFKTITKDNPWTSLIKFLDKTIEQPPIALKYYTTAASIIAVLTLCLDRQNIENNADQANNAMFALGCLCFLPIIAGNAYQTLRQPCKLVWSFFVPPKDDYSKYIQPPRQAPSFNGV